MTTRNFDKFAPAFNQAVSAYKAGKFADAEQLCQRIISADRNHFDAVHVLAVAQAALGKRELALASYDRALALRPNHADVLSNRGSVLLALNRHDEALESYDRALVTRPAFPEAFSNRGIALEKIGRLDEAIASHDRALALRPGYADAHNNRGQLLRELMRYDEALACYDRALAVQPQHVMAHCNAAALRLLLGDFARGWADYEWRWLKDSVILANRMFPQPLWRGEDIAGKTILLHGEQGFGDAIQFCRYVPLVAARGAKVILKVQQPLHAILTGLAGAAQVIVRGSPLPEFDVHCPLLSLPLAFATRLETIPSTHAYLAAPAQHSAHWQTRLAAHRRPRIGLAWSGNAGHERDRERSIGLREILPLLTAEATFVSLQKDIRTEDAAVLKQRGDILDLGQELGDFS